MALLLRDLFALLTRDLARDLVALLMWDLLAVLLGDFLGDLFRDLVAMLPWHLFTFFRIAGPPAMMMTFLVILGLAHLLEGSVKDHFLHDVTLRSIISFAPVVIQGVVAVMAFLLVVHFALVNVSGVIGLLAPRMIGGVAFLLVLCVVGGVVVSVTPRVIVHSAMTVKSCFVHRPGLDVVVRSALGLLPDEDPICIL